MILFLLVQLALADVVDDPPADCAPGSRGQTSHNGTWCEPYDCADDPNRCTDGTTCQAVNQCIIQFTYTVDSATPHDVTRDEVVGLCADDGSCAEGTCTTMTVCADESALPNDKTCGCASSQHAPAALFAIGAMALIRRRSSQITPG